MTISFDAQFIQELSTLIPESLVEEIRSIQFPPEEGLDQLFLLTTNLQHVLRQHGEFGRAAMVAEYINPKIEDLISRHLFPESDRSRKRLLDEDVSTLKHHRACGDPDPLFASMETDQPPFVAKDRELQQSIWQSASSQSLQSGFFLHMSHLQSLINIKYELQKLSESPTAVEVFQSICCEEERSSHPSQPLELAFQLIEQAAPTIFSELLFSQATRMANFWKTTQESKIAFFKPKW